MHKVHVFYNVIGRGSVTVNIQIEFLFLHRFTHINNLYIRA